jgi:3-oxoacyl-[acyl-carrier-protein] synthase III
MTQHFRILGSARRLPRRAISASELDRRLGLPQGWTARHTGVLMRHQSAGPEEAETLTREVCLAALADAGKTLANIDLIVDASLCVQQPIPCNAALVQKTLGLGARGIPCIDIHASCLGFVTALNVVNGLFASGSAQRALIVCAETPLQGVNWDEPESACLMGDGAVAFVLESAHRNNPCCFLMETYAEGAHLCEVRGGGHRLSPYAYTEAQRDAYQFHMDGKAVHKLASKHLPQLLAKVLARTGHHLEKLNTVPHQASGPALEFVRRRLGLQKERFHVSIAEHGNMVAAGIPYVLDSVRRRLPDGSPILVLGTAAGYTQAAAIFEL